MRVEWYGQSAFHLSDGEHAVAIDPFGDMSALTGRGIEFDYPAIEGATAELLLVTHEHTDHTGVEVIGGDPTILRSTAGQLESPLGTVTAVASEHDEEAGTARGPNTIFAFELDGLRVCHFGDFGQSELREAQASAIGQVDLLFIPVGGGPTIGSQGAHSIIERLSPRWVVPMHYRTERTNFLDTADEFLASADRVERLPGSSFETAELPAHDGPLIVVPVAP